MGFKIGYFGNTFFKNKGGNYERKIYSILEECNNLEIKYLICTGGMSYNYHLSLDFINEMNQSCKSIGVKFYFILGNTDFYYDSSESLASKENKFRDILGLYKSNPMYLPNRTLFFSGVRVNGFESWYDYTLYRGNPTDLKNITKKSKFFIKNKDVKYITDSSDYLSGVNSTFDVKYTKTTLSNMHARLSSYEQKWGAVNRNILFQYFMPSKVFLGNSVIPQFEKYFGTFKGSCKYMEIYNRYKVTDCIIGIKCGKNYPSTYQEIKFYNSYNSVQYIDLNIE